MDDRRPAEDPWVGVEAVAAHLGVGRETVYRWVESRGLPAHRLGRLLRFRLADVDTWVAGRRVDRVAESGSAYGTAPEAAADPVASAIDEMVRILVERFDPERIVLFGSHARGKAGPDSDVDLLVVMPFEGSKREKRIEIRLALHHIKVPKDIVLASPDEVERYGDMVGGVLYPALSEGRTLHVRGDG